MVKVVVAISNHSFRSRIQMIFEKNNEFLVIGYVNNLGTAIELQKRTRSDVILIDDKLHDFKEDALEFFEDKNKLKIILFISKIDEDNRRIIGSGIYSLISKEINEDELINIVKLVSNGFKIIQDDIAKWLEYPNARKNLAYINEKRILQMIVDGKSNKEIAVELSLAEGSVKNISSRLIRKFGLKDRTQLALFAVKNCLV